MGEISGSDRDLQRRNPSLVSVVVPVFNERENLKPLADGIQAALKDTNYELILVDDGSGDGTFDEIEKLASANPKIVGLSLSRNFGHQYALAAGLRHARGDAVVTMDGDMQHPPELLPVLIDKWREGFNIVQTKRLDTQKVGWLKRVTSQTFYAAFGMLCGIRIDPGMADFRLLDRAVLDEINEMQEGQLFLRGLIAWMGYRRAVVPFEVGQRHSGKTKYTMAKMFKLAKAGLFSFSSIPLRVGVTVGFIIAFLSFAELLYVVISYFTQETVPGWASTVGITSMLFGVLFLLIGIQGEYILRIYERVQRRPPFLIERVVGQETEARPDLEGEKPRAEHLSRPAPHGHSARRVVR